jgi:hypothetical protein
MGDVNKFHSQKKQRECKPFLQDNWKSRKCEKCTVRLSAAFQMIYTWQNSRWREAKEKFEKALL